MWHFNYTVHGCRDSQAKTAVHRTYNSIRNIQMFILLFNLVNRHVIFTTKLLSIVVSITSGYAAIAHFKDYPIFGVMYYILFIDITLTYTLIYEMGFKVSSTFHKAKNLLQFHAAKNGNAFERRILRKQIMSIQSVGIKVGEFHMLERTSTPVFLHYILTHIVNMLVAFGDLT